MLRPFRSYIRSLVASRGLPSGSLYTLINIIISHYHLRAACVYCFIGVRERVCAWLGTAAHLSPVYDVYVRTPINVHVRARACVGVRVVRDRFAQCDFLAGIITPPTLARPLYSGLKRRRNDYNDYRTENA